MDFRIKNAKKNPPMETTPVNADELNRLRGVWNDYRELQQKESKGEVPPGTFMNYWRSNRKDLERFADLRRQLDKESNG
jgi:hypothetical protein